jgi:flagellar protein FliJ
MNGTAHTQGLSTLIEHAERERDEALTLVATTQRQLAQQTQQAELLLSYRDEYRARHPAQGGRSAGPQLLHVHQAFMQRLEHSRAVHAQQMHATHTRLQRQQAALQAAELRLATAHKLQERRVADVLRVQQRQEQRRSDDAAQKRSPMQHGTWRLGSEPMPL